MSQAQAILERQSPHTQRPPVSRPAYFDEAECQLQKLLGLLSALAADAEGGDSVIQAREALRDSGLLAASIPRSYGGLGVEPARLHAMSRRIAAVNRPLAYVFTTHHAQIVTLLRYGNPDQKEYMLGRTVSDQGFWGNAVNFLDTQVKALRRPGGYILNGLKSFCAGAPGSDYLLVSATLPDGSPLCAAVASQQRGIAIRDEWQGLGGREIGSVEFDAVSVAKEAALAAHSAPVPETVLD